MKKAFFWLMSLAILCSCTNSIEEVAVNSSDELKTKSGLPTVTVTLSFSMGQSTQKPTGSPSYAQAHCTVVPDIDFNRIEFPLYNTWQWVYPDWVKVYLTDLLVFTASGDYLTGLPFIAGANTVVFIDDIEIYPESLKDQYNFVYQTVGLPLVYELPEKDEPGPVDGGGIIEDTYDSLTMRIKKPIVPIIP